MGLDAPDIADSGDIRDLEMFVYWKWPSWNRYEKKLDRKIGYLRGPSDWNFEGFLGCFWNGAKWWFGETPHEICPPIIIHINL